MHIGSAMIENIIEADPEYAEVAEEYEEDILVIGFPEAFNNFPLSGSCPRCIIPTFQQLLCLFAH
jgi:hypothetical protein